MIGLRIIAGIILGIWFVLVLMGKGGFVYTLLLTAIGVAAVDVMCVLRRRVISDN